MDLYEALYTTRAMRRVSPEPIPSEAVQRMLDAAVRAPSAGNTQNWRFVAVTDPDVRSSLGPLYADAWATLNATVYKGMREAAEVRGDDQTKRIMTSADWLAANFAEVPLIVFAYHRNDADGSSIYPAVWNMMLAARGMGIGCTLTTVLGHFKHDEVAALLEVPADRGWKNAAAIPCGYPLGRWGVATRPPVETVVYADRWGTAPEWTVPEALWSPSGD
ncbi:MAG: nitroreductase family protein [Acidimicrobiia bacterium]|nr:nitroreductase family protein [Acidimicrobiia bacterium]